MTGAIFIGKREQIILVGFVILLSTFIYIGQQNLEKLKEQKMQKNHNKIISNHYIGDIKGISKKNLSIKKSKDEIKLSLNNVKKIKKEGILSYEIYNSDQEFLCFLSLDDYETYISGSDEFYLFRTSCRIYTETQYGDQLYADFHQYSVYEKPFTEKDINIIRDAFINKCKAIKKDRFRVFEVNESRKYFYNSEFNECFGGDSIIKL